MKRKMRYGWWLAVALCALTGVALASTPQAVRKQVEASRLLTGTVDIDQEGRVTAHTFKDVDDLAPAMRSWLDQRVEQWRFEPVVIDGKPRLARTNMSLRLVLKPMPDDKFSFKIASADFHPDRSAASVKPEEDVRSKRMTPPQYPKELIRMGVSGTVYLALRVGPDGKVVDVAAEQVNLRVVASERDMERFRKQLTKASVDAARYWKFTPPTEGEEAKKEFWRVRAPIDFIGPDARIPKENDWTAYIPGPRAIIPWLDYDGLLPPDALAAGGVYPLRENGVRLKTALD